MKKILVILFILIFAASFTTSAQETESPGCVALDGLSITGTTIDFGALEFYEGETLEIIVSVDGTEFSLIDDLTTTAVEGPVAVGSTLTYIIPATATYDFSIEITGITAVPQYDSTCTPPVLPEDDYDPDGDGKAEVCHFPPGNPDAAHTINVGVSAVDAHLGHGDMIGECPEGIDSREDDDDSGLVLFILKTVGEIEIYGLCEGDTCSPIAIIILDDLEPTEGFELVYTDDESPYEVVIYYLHPFPDEFDLIDIDIYVYQINIYLNDTLISDKVLLLVDEDGNIIAWGNHGFWDNLEEFIANFGL